MLERTHMPSSRQIYDTESACCAYSGVTSCFGFTHCKTTSIWITYTILFVEYNVCFAAVILSLLGAFMRPLTYCGPVTPYGNIGVANSGSGNGLLHDFTKPLPYPMWLYLQRCSVSPSGAITQEIIINFSRIMCSAIALLKWPSHFPGTNEISHVPQGFCSGTCIIVSNSYDAYRLNKSGTTTHDMESGRYTAGSKSTKGLVCTWENVWCGAGDNFTKTPIHWKVTDHKI